MATAPTLTPLCDIVVKLGDPLELGPGPRGVRRIIPIIGGHFRGERLNGTVLNLGADWQTVLPESLAELDTRYCLRTDDGALIDIRNFGYRHGPAHVIDALRRGEDVDATLYYMRTHARFETGDPRYDWLNRSICVGSGAREKSAVRISIFTVD